MAEGHNYQLLTAIVKIVRPKNSPVLGIADGIGKFMWLPTDKIIISHPQQFDVWQTTIFAIDHTWKITWKEEQNWEQYKNTYSNTKPIIQPVPSMFIQQTVPQAQMPPTQSTMPINQPIVPTTATQPANHPEPSTTTAPPNMFQPSQTIPEPLQGSIPNTSSDSIISPPQVGKDVYLAIIANELTSIRKLFELFINPPKLITADELVVENMKVKTMEQITEEFGAPPAEEEALINKQLESKTNKGKLPNIF
ncbi:hypothetical protein LCGC14_0224640 [marine sediment metagenome]|uniref:Uncharacterized protein n=1 Tax=marine sediment metagenome TaxID=412755 RepID=A0A0F9UCH6_9ZZZZ|nr:hypothetical protein [bacterium]